MPKVKILIVEDEKIVARDIQKSVEIMGYFVCAIASSGEEAVQKAGETRPDLTLMDIVLKGEMDGIKAAEQINALFKIPIVYLTAYDDEDILQRAKITTPYGYITKPFNDRELRIAIEIALYKNQAEAKIRKTELWLATVLRSVGDAVIASDRVGRITFMNQMAEKLTGWKQEDALGKKLTEVLHIKDEELGSLEKHLVEKVITQGLIINLLEDRLLVAKDGTVIPISDSVAPIRGDDGETPGTVLIFRDITERKREEGKLRTSRLQLRALYTRLQQIREEERVLISREIHDEMGGGLTGLKMDLSWLLHKVYDTEAGKERVALMDRIHTSNALIDQMIQVVRRISTDLRPSVLDDLGLIAALEWQLSEFTSRTGISHEFVTAFDYINLKKDTAVAVFRIFQETLTNVARHSGATKVTVLLREGERSLFEDGSFFLEIRDNGRGITEGEILDTKSLGILGMSERALVFGGDLRISGEPDSGTTVVLKIPRKQGEPS